MKTELKQISGEVWEEKMNYLCDKIINNLPTLMNLLGYEEKLLSAEEACQLLNITRKTLDNYRSTRQLPFVPGKPCRYKRYDLLKWRDQQLLRFPDSFSQPTLIQNQIKAILLAG